MSKIRTLIFDFGDVFINLVKEGAMQNALNLFNIKAFEEDMINANIQYEVGAISTKQFLDFYSNKFPTLNEAQIIDAWNFIIKDFPQHRLEFIQNLAQDKSFNLMLLSNTNEMHINYITSSVSFYEDFKSCFDKFYLSHEIHLRKPNVDIFEFVLRKNNLKPNECLFVDDTRENTVTANEIGFNTWNLDETKEDVVTIFETKQALF